MGKESANGWSGGKTDRTGGSKNPQSDAQHMRGEGSDTDERSNGSDHGSSNSLDNPGSKEIIQIRRETTGCRSKSEYDKSADKDLFHEAPVCDLSEDEEESCHHEKIGDDDPGDGARGSIEVGSDRRKSDVHNRTVKSVHNDAKRECP